MRDTRNPFRMRASEHIESDTVFLRLFGPGVLELIPKDAPFSQPHLLRSAPGGGKTSLLRAFTPTSLVNLYANRLNDEYRELHAKMKEMGAMDDSGPQLLGVMLSCGKSYATLDELRWDDLLKERIFFAFLNCRILLSAMRACLQLHNLDYPRELRRLTFQGSTDAFATLGAPENGNGDDMLAWARLIESSISSVLDSLDPTPRIAPGHADLASLTLLRPLNVLLDGRPAATRVLVMFDDVHKLSMSQRRSLGHAVTQMREPAGIWLAERLEVLSQDELLDVGSKHGRDFNDSAPTVEHYWRTYPSRFERTVMSIADKRVREAQPVEIDSFASCLQSSLETPDSSDRLEEVAREAEAAVKRQYAGKQRFREWIPAVESVEGTAFERAIAWQSLSILIAREVGRKQLAFEFALEPAQLDKRGNTAVRAAAELFLAKQFDLPYYYGPPRLAALAFSNIEQSLAIEAELFEEASAAALLKRPYQLSARRQHAILKRVSRQWWQGEALRAIPLQSEVKRFLESIGRFAGEQTYQPNAPYAPGVTGISITMAEREKFLDSDVLSKRRDLRELVEVIGVCLAHNLLEAELDRSQNYGLHMILYLNRLLCCHFDLPLQYGGWRHRKPEVLVSWLREGLRPTSNGQERRML